MMSTACTVFFFFSVNDSYVKREGDDLLIIKKYQDRGSQCTDKIYLSSAKEIFNVSRYQLLMIKLQIVITIHLVTVSWISYAFFFNYRRCLDLYFDLAIN